MTGLSEKERAGCTKILTQMTKADLLSLTDTVTNKMIVVEKEKEAMETILSFSKSAEELLRRKKVQRNLIFTYLAKEGVVMPPNSEKHVLIKRTLELWSSNKAEEHRAGQHTDRDVKSNPEFDPQLFGQQFCQWFFSLLNSQNTSMGQEPGDWGPQHFWPDAKLRLFARACGEQMEEFCSAEMVSLRLLALIREERLLLNPNLEPHALKALSSPHGLVLVAVAGTIHRDAACLGIFEQIFGVIRSPMDNKWKIKFINLKIRGQNAIGEEEVSAPALTFNSSDLQLPLS